MQGHIPDAVKRIYPFQTHSFRTPAGARMSYVDEGPRSSEAVLLLHGNPTWSFLYRDLIRAMAAHVRCIAPDHIGMGLSEKPQDYSYTLEQRIQDIQALVTHLGVSRIRLVVHDWGGAIGFGFATRHPETIDRISMLNTAAFVSDQIPGRIALCRAGGLGKLIVRGFNGFAWPATWMAMHTRSLTAEEKAGYLMPYDSWANRVAVHQFVADIPMEASHPTRPTLRGIEDKLGLLSAVPKQIVWGGRDFCFNDHFLERWRSLYPDAVVHRLSEAGHYVLDDGGEEARTLVARFVTSGR